MQLAAERFGINEVEYFSVFYCNSKKMRAKIVILLTNLLNLMLDLNIEGLVESCKS